MGPDVHNTDININVVDAFRILYTKTVKNYIIKSLTFNYIFTCVSSLVMNICCTCVYTKKWWGGSVFRSVQNKHNHGGGGGGEFFTGSGILPFTVDT